MILRIICLCIEIYWWAKFCEASKKKDYMKQNEYGFFMLAMLVVLFNI